MRSRRPEVAGSDWMQWLLATACGLLLSVKFWLIPRLNINWDEFLYLSQVHAAARGEVAQAMQTAYTHLFGWLPGLAGDEIEQIRAARVLMVALLGISTLMIQRLAARWLNPVAAWAAALAFLAMWPTLKHGGSFRADSLLLPLQLGALLTLTHPGLGDRSRGSGAGVLLGLATAVSVKAVLLAPLVIALGVGSVRECRRGLVRLIWLAGTALVSTTALIGAHLLSLSVQDVIAATGATVEGAWHKTLRDAPWLPQVGTLQEMLHEDLVFWLAAAAGTALALWRRMWLVAVCALALLPIVFYRNSFAYYYVVMWGPACVTIAAAVAAVYELASRVARPAITRSVILALAGLFAAQGLRDLSFLSQPRQDAQRQLVAAVHAIFPDPVPYIDHSGMIASFRKVNFFMSTWGVDNYVARGRPFMPSVLSRFRPPMLIANRAELVQGTGNYAALFQEDRRLIETSYLPYWGPILVAGASATPIGSQPVVLEFPFGGDYRLASLAPAMVDGTLVSPGGVITLSDPRLAVHVSAGPGEEAEVPEEIRFVWAAARPPPRELPISLNYYDPL